MTTNKLFCERIAIRNGHLNGGSNWILYCLPLNTAGRGDILGMKHWGFLKFSISRNFCHRRGVYGLRIFNYADQVDQKV